MLRGVIRGDNIGRYMKEVKTIVEFTLKDLIIEDGIVTRTIRKCTAAGELTDEKIKCIKEELDEL